MMTHVRKKIELNWSFVSLDKIHLQNLSLAIDVFCDCLKHCTLPKPLNFSNLRSCYVTLSGFSLFFNQNFLYPDFVLAENHLTLLLFSSHLTVFEYVFRM